MPITDPNAYGSSWYYATKVASPPRGPLTVELDVDVCVIGGGLAGLTAAREVARRGWSVVVLEAQRVAWNASGRNTGFVLPGFAAGADALVKRVGLDHAKALWALSEAGGEYVRNAIGEAAMPGIELAEGGWLHVSKTGDDGATKAYADLLAGQFGAAAEFWPAGRVREQLRSPLYFGAIHYPRAFSIHPLNYALGLAAAAEASGARICEETPALEVDPGGVRKRIVTKQARLRAAHVVLAGNVHLGRLMPQFASTLLPVHSYVIATAPLGAQLREAIRYPGAVSDTDLADNHYRVAGDRLVWSGRSTVWRGKPQRYVETLLGDIGRAYPQLRDVRAEYAWTGALGLTMHRMPQIGEILPGVWLLSGFGGHGLNTTAIGGEILARAIVEGDRTWRLFVPFGMVWAGGLSGRAAQQLYYWSFRTRERLQGWLARRRAAKASAMASAHAPAGAAVSPSAASAEQAAAAEPEAGPAAPAVEGRAAPPEVEAGAGAPAPTARRRRRQVKKGADSAAAASNAAPAGTQGDEASSQAPGTTDKTPTTGTA
jgi:glycine/D-amino acid oxidase-like deaminating enzyme